MVVAQRLKPGEQPVDPGLLLGCSHKRKSESDPSDPAIRKRFANHGN
jgi:hypothetical protein